MTLTEKWKKGELPDGFYYFRLPDGNVEIASEYKLIRYNLIKDADKIEILAPVPTYQEYLESESHCAVYSDRNKWLKDENAKLKELLKECKEFFEEENPKDFTVISERMDDLLTRINAAIGESEE